VELNDDSYQYVIAGDFLNFSHNNLGFSAPRLRYLVLDALTTDPVGRFFEPKIQLSTERAEGSGFDSPVRKMRRISGGGVVPLVTVPTAAARYALTTAQAPIGSVVLQLAGNLLYRRVGDDTDDVADEDPEIDWLLLTGEFDPPSYYAMGDFVTAFDNEIQPYVVRVGRDGTTLTTHEDWVVAPNPNARVNDIAIDGDNAVIVGEFTTVSGTSFNRIARFDNTGVVDVLFNAAQTGFNNHAYGIVIDPLALHVTVVGDFTQYNGATVGHIARLDSLTGTHDATYPAGQNGIGVGTGANGTIRAMTRQPDGRIIIAGSFTSYNGIPRSGIARLEPDGSLDTSFTPKGDASGVLAFANDFNGGPVSANLFARPIVVGNFSNLYGNSGFKGVARLLGGSFPGVWYQPSEIEISASPSPYMVVAGSDKSLHVVASDNRIGFDGIPPAVMPYVPALTVQAPSEPIFYQWQLNGRDIPGANQSSLDLNDVKYTQAGSYRVKIYNSQYYIYSQNVQLTVLNPFIGIIPTKGIKVNGRIDANAGLNSNLGGTISMTISRLGSVTGTITMAGSGSKPVKYKFAGQFDESGNLLLNIPRKNLSPLTLTLDMDMSGAPNDFTFDSMTNSISDGVNIAQISAWNNRWSSTNLASAYAGQYNVGLVTDAGALGTTLGAGSYARPQVSQGYGYFSMKIAATTGQARIAGTLSDGSKFTTTTTLWGDTPATTLPIWIPLYKSGGALQGEAYITAGGENPVTADLYWSKPSGLAKTTDTYGFTNVNLTASLESGLYTVSDFTSTLPSFTLTFADGTLWTPTNGGISAPSAPSFSQSFNVAGTTITTILPNNKSVKISINQTSGLVTGSFIDPDAYGANRTVKFQSMILTQGPTPVLRGNFVMPNTTQYTEFYVGGSVEGY
jgi:Domain of unknown function (DUF5122) beta-propeller